MGKKIVIQRKGQTMKEGTIGHWLKKDGETVKAGEALYELEYDKANCVIEAPADGILHIYQEEGSTLPVGTLIAELLKEGETGSGQQAAAQCLNGEADSKKAAAEGKPQAASGSTERVRATPYARKIARMNGISLQEVPSGKGKNKIVAADVEAWLAKKQMLRTARTEDAVEEKRVPMSAMRRAVAQNMLRSHSEIPSVTYFTEADVTECMNLRKELNEEYREKGVKVSVNDLVLKAAAAALKKHPDINVSLDGEEMVCHAGIHIGIAVAVPGGLVVPVIRDADKKAPDVLAGEARELAGKALAGSLTGDEMAGGTFTVSNLGNRGIDWFTPIINGNQSAILGVGCVKEKPVVLNGTVAIRSVMALSLTADHRVIDGAPAADFLCTLKRILEKPVFMLI